MTAAISLVLVAGSPALSAADPTLSTFTVAAQVVIALRVGLAALLGAAVGWERGRSGKTAGVRTHLLVSCASGLATGLSSVLFLADNTGDPTRVLHGVVTGVGFLGAGLIFKEHKGAAPTGVTSAATMFLVAVIGATCGLGAPVLAAFVTVMALLSLRGIRELETRASARFATLRSRYGHVPNEDDN